jgi:hypothetical protein
MIQRTLIAVLFPALILTSACRSLWEVTNIKESSRYLRDILTWLPADTETLIVANGPFWMSDFIVYKERNREISTEELEKNFRLWTLGEFSVLGKALDRERVVIAAEGSRHFRGAGSLGVIPYEGCQIAVFAYDQSRRMKRFMKESGHAALRVETIEGQKVIVFQEKREENIWTLFVANPRSKVVAIATNRDYLQQVLSRMNGNVGRMALPESLPEWRHVNRQARFWGLRHFSKDDSEKDPTSPLGDDPYERGDRQAIGLTFQCIPGDSEKTAVVTYLSANPDIRRHVEVNLFPDDRGREGLKIRYRNSGPEAVEISVKLDHSSPLGYFTFFLMGYLGHAVYL